MCPNQLTILKPDYMKTVASMVKMDTKICVENLILIIFTLEHFFRRKTPSPDKCENPILSRFWGVSPLNERKRTFGSENFSDFSC